MVKVRYSEVTTGCWEDQEHAEKIKTIEIEYSSEEKELCITVDIDNDGRYFAYWVDLERFYKAIRIAIERDELNKDNFGKYFSNKEI